jgi:hypothetical protein
MSLRADVAELVDAHGSGPCVRNQIESACGLNSIW